VIGHTPGPWGSSKVLRGAVVGRHGSSAGLVLAQVTEFVPKYRAESEANARLISAAPELLEALLAILGPLNVCSDNKHVRDEEVLPLDITMGELRAARAAIAKARGEAL
jgi:hypothetical protein